MAVDSKITRLSVNINSDVANALKDVAARRQISITEAVRRAVAIWKFVEDENLKGNTIQVVNHADNSVKEIVFS
jgi:hypothetical protein